MEMHIWLINHIIKINLIACRVQKQSQEEHACSGKKKRKEKSKA
jgi:hypothetical protein